MHAEAKASELGLSVPEGPASQAQAVEIASWRFHRERFVSLRCFDDREVVRRWARRRGAQVISSIAWMAPARATGKISGSKGRARAMASNELALCFLQTASEASSCGRLDRLYLTSLTSRARA